MKKFIQILLVLSTAWAEARFTRDEYPGVRALGMGNAFIGLADDSNAMWYNPASLVYNKGVRQNLLQVQVGADTLETFNRLLTAVSTGNTNDLFKMDGSESMRMNIRPTWSIPYLSFSAFETFNLYSNIKNLNTLDMIADIYAINDIGAMLGLAYPVNDYFSIGVSAKGFVRLGIDHYITLKDIVDQIPLSENPDVSSVLSSYMTQLLGVGWTVAGNVSFLWKLPHSGKGPKVSFGGNVENLGTTSFFPLGSFNVPPRLPQTYNFGANLQFPFGGKNSVLNINIDSRRTFQSIGLERQLCIGAEWRTKYFGLRTGVYNGYATYGASLEFPPHTRIHFSSFATELGDQLWVNANRMYLLEIIIGANPL